MSLSQNKQALFGSKKTDGGKSSSTTSKPAPAPTAQPAAPVSATAGKSSAVKFTGASSGMSLIEKQKKIEEARELSEKGMTYLKTSMFKWEPDHLAAGPVFESSAEKYKIIGEYKISTDVMVKAVESHIALRAFAAAALALRKASETAKLAGDGKRCLALLKQAADNWGMHGDTQRYGETLVLAAKEVRIFLFFL